jgi:hypothetical protein
MMSAQAPVAVAAALAAAGCLAINTDAEAERVGAMLSAGVLGAPAGAIYGPVQTRLMDRELVNLRVSMEGARGAQDILAYARCAAAQYTLIRGYGFARHVRTNLHREAAVWSADAVYVVSSDLPQGTRTIDAEVTVADCTEQGIPTV